MRKLLNTCLATALLAAAAPAPGFAGEVKRYVEIVLNSPVPGREAEFNAWFDKVHIPDLLKIPGVKSAQRFKVALESPLTVPQSYMAVFEIETDDVAGVRQAISDAAKTPAMVVSPALDRPSVRQTFYSAVTDKVEAR